MKICKNCGHRNFKLIQNKNKQFICSECGDRLSDGSITHHGHNLNFQGSGDNNYSMGKIKDSDYIIED